MKRSLCLLPLLLVLVGCARSLPPYEKPLARSEYQTVRTTAYTSSERDHRKYTNHNACGTCLLAGQVNSAAADWSRWPVGTLFEVMETGEFFRVDDYGWALTRRNTIDLYKPTAAEMNRWGVRRVQIHILQWGSLSESDRILESRKRFRHVRAMLKELRPQI